MFEKDIKPFDTSEIHTTRELFIKTKFDKASGGMMIINSEIFQKAQEPVPPGVIGYMLIAALHIWCNNLKANNADPQTLEQAHKILPKVMEILKIVQFINPDMEIKNLMSQLDGSNNNNQPSMPPK